MVTRISRKPEIQFSFRKLPDEPYVTSWLSVNVPAKNKRLRQKGNFQLEGKIWDEPTIQRLEQLSAKHKTLQQAAEESIRDQPTTTLPKERYRDLLTERDPYWKWLQQCQEANQAYTAIQVQLASVEEEMVHHNIIPTMLNRIIPLEGDNADERTYVLYRSAVWRSDRDLTPEQWQAMMDHVLEREDAELAAALSPPSLGGSTREPIPSEVRRAVWIRDQGKCARCGSRERLEYDHIVPVSRGGSNTERNIELLCEFHNRAKSNNIS